MKTELSLDAAGRAISFISPDDRDVWVKIGMALKDEYGEEAKDTWLHWSEGAKNFSQKSADHVWKSIKSGKVTIGSLIYEARQFGWRPEKNDSVRITPEDYARKQAERERRRALEEDENKRKAERAAQRAAAMWESAVPAESHPYLTRKGILPHGSRILPVWERRHTDEVTGEIITVSVLNVLLVPIYCSPRCICSLQAIFPERNEILARDKDYLPGGTKQGGYFTFGAITKSTLRVVLCEGFATGASIHEATGYVTVSCFDAGNLPTVAEAIRAKLPDIEIVMAGDNDLWTKGNPGARKANAAAHAVHGRVALPIFADYEGEPTDFNDLRDPGEVKLQIDAAIEPTNPEHYTPECRWEPADSVEPQPEVGDAGAASSNNTGSGSPNPPKSDDATVQPETPPPADQAAEGGAHVDRDDDYRVNNTYFRILGYDHDRYYIFQHERRQLTVFSLSSFTDVGFMSLAPLDWWEMEFPSKNGFAKPEAINWFIRKAHERGIFDPSLTRGRGAWVDRGRIVLHMGDRLIVDGNRTEITEFKSRYTYELHRSLPELSHDAMTSDEGEELLSLMMRFRWSKPASAPMLAGWIALAPLCGAFRWRPHVWLTGGSGTGKSWILDNIVCPLIRGMHIHAQGNSTEAGIRQTLRQDALPVVFDESEKNNDKEKSRVDGVIALIRQASTESAARTLKGTAFGDAQHYHIRSMFCLASVQVGIDHQADLERITVLSLKPKREGDDTSPERWAATQNIAHDMIKKDEDFSGRLFRRSLNLLPTTLQNIEVFSTAGAKKFGAQRDGDQYGALMAGAWSLISDRVATPEEAEAMLNSYDWHDYMEHTDSDDSMKALGAIMGAHVRLHGGQTLTIHELILLSQLIEVEGVPKDLAGPQAKAALGRYGIKIDGNDLLFATSTHQLIDLISDTPFANDLKNLLLRVKGAKRHSKVIWVAGLATRAVSIPLAPLIDTPDLVTRARYPDSEERPF